TVELLLPAPAGRRPPERGPAGAVLDPVPVRAGDARMGIPLPRARVGPLPRLHPARRHRRGRQGPRRVNAPAFPLAPAGWGYKPGAQLVLEALPEDTLPNLPLLRLVAKDQRGRVIAEALATHPGLPFITVPQVMRRYGISQVMATNALERARGAR